MSIQRQFDDDHIYMILPKEVIFEIIEGLFLASNCCYKHEMQFKGIISTFQEMLDEEIKDIDDMIDEIDDWLRSTR